MFRIRCQRVGSGPILALEVRRIGRHIRDLGNLPVQVLRRSVVILDRFFGVARRSGTQTVIHVSPMVNGDGGYRRITGIMPPPSDILEEEGRHMARKFTHQQRNGPGKASWLTPFPVPALLTYTGVRDAAAGQGMCCSRFDALHIPEPSRDRQKQDSDPYRPEVYRAARI